MLFFCIQEEALLYGIEPTDKSDDEGEEEAATVVVPGIFFHYLSSDLLEHIQRTFNPLAICDDHGVDHYLKLRAFVISSIEE